MTTLLKSGFNTAVQTLGVAASVYGTSALVTGNNMGNLSILDYQVPVSIVNAVAAGLVTAWSKTISDMLMRLLPKSWSNWISLGDSLGETIIAAALPGVGMLVMGNMSISQAALVSASNAIGIQLGKQFMNQVDSLEDALF